MSAPGTDPEPEPEPESPQQDGSDESGADSAAAPGGSGGGSADSVRTARGMTLWALASCVLAAVAAVVAFVNGNWVGIVWALLVGVTSNMAWYYGRRAHFFRSAPQGRDGATE